MFLLRSLHFYRLLCSLLIRWKICFVNSTLKLRIIMLKNMMQLELWEFTIWNCASMYIKFKNSDVYSCTVIICKILMTSISSQIFKISEITATATINGLVDTDWTTVDLVFGELPQFPNLTFVNTTSLFMTSV